MKLRDATPQDLNAIRQLVAEVGEEFGFPPEPNGADADLFGGAGSYFGSRALLAVLERDGAIVGVLGVLPRSGATYELRKLYLSATERSCGHGRRLANRAIEYAREQGASRMVLQSSRKLDAALELYRSLGFAETTDDAHSDTCDVAMELVIRRTPRKK